MLGVRLVWTPRLRLASTAFALPPTVSGQFRPSLQVRDEQYLPDATGSTRSEEVLTKSELNPRQARIIVLEKPYLASVNNRCGKETFRLHNWASILHRALGAANLP